MDTEELMKDWKKFRLSEEEERTRIEFDTNLDSLISDQMNHCLVGKLLTSRTIVPGIIKNTFSNEWRTNLNFSVDSLGRNVYLFKFDAKRDKEMVLKLGPWLFDNILLVLEDPKVNLRLSQLPFNKAAFWIRLIDIPLKFQNKFMAKKLGEAFGEFLKVDCYQDNFCWRENLRIKISVDISKPLRRGIWINLGTSQESLWIQAKYERLPEFCYDCGRIGHLVKECRSCLKENDIEGWQFRSWLQIQGQNPRRRRKASPRRDDKGDVPFNASAAKFGSFSSNERVSESLGKSLIIPEAKDLEEHSNQHFQVPLLKLT